MGEDQRYNIALFGCNAFSGYESSIWSGAIDAARQYDVNLFSFASGDLLSWNRYSTEKLISPVYLDGIIGISGSLGSQSSDHEMESFYRQFSPLPVVSVSRMVNGVYNIVVKNETGIHQLMKHLIEEHHYQRIAFISGPINNQEAVLRLKAYQESLRQYGMAYDEDLVFYGDFFWDGGSAAISAFLDERKVKMDAIVAANDYMAIFAMRELRRRGYQIPGDIAVVGFDDVNESEAMDLTTVKQPLTRMGNESVKMLLTLIKHDQSPQGSDLCLPTELIIRGSCGCFKHDHFSKEPLISYKSDSDNQGCPHEPIIHGLNREFPEFTEKLGENWAGGLIDSLDDQTGQPFLKTLEASVGASMDKGLAMVTWYDILRFIEKNNIGCDRNEIQMCKIMKDAFEIIGRLSLAMEKHQRNQFEELYNTMQMFYQGLNNSFDIFFGIKRWFREYLPQLKVESYFIAHYTESDPKTAKLFDYYHEKEYIQLNPTDDVFPVNALVPGVFRRDGERYSYYVLPIMRLGYALFDVSELETPAYFPFIGQISTAIKLTSISDEIIQYASKLEEKVAERTKELAEAQKQLVASAHQAGMAEIAINVLHNMGNVLNSAMVSIEEIQEGIHNPAFDGMKKVDEMLSGHKDDFGSFLLHDPRAKVLPDYISKIAQMVSAKKAMIAGEVRQITEKFLLMQETILTLQDYARTDICAAYQEKVEVDRVIETALRIEESHLQKHGVRVEKELQPIGCCSVDKNKFVHVLVNLIKNAVEAMENTPPEERSIIIRLMKNDQNEAEIEIADRGEGLAEDQFNKIFMYGFTTKKNGHGFGLHSSANYMKEMGGTLKVKNGGAGKGATFSLTLPLKEYPQSDHAD